MTPDLSEPGSDLVVRQERRRHGTDPCTGTDHYSEWRASIREVKHRRGFPGHVRWCVDEPRGRWVHADDPRALSTRDWVATWRRTPGHRAAGSDPGSRSMSPSPPTAAWG